MNLLRSCILGAALLITTLFMGCSPSNKPQTFEVGKQTFLLDGKPFVIKAAEMHYTRIPARVLGTPHTNVQGIGHEHHLHLCLLEHSRTTSR